MRTSLIIDFLGIEQWRSVNIIDFISGRATFFPNLQSFYELIIDYQLNSIISELEKKAEVNFVLNKETVNITELNSKFSVDP